MAGFKLLMISQLAHKILDYLLISPPERGGDSTESSQPCPRKSPRHTQGEHHFPLLGQKEWLKEARTVMTKFLPGECGRTGGRGGLGSVKLETSLHFSILVSPLPGLGGSEAAVCSGLLVSVSQCK